MVILDLLLIYNDHSNTVKVKKIDGKIILFAVKYNYSRSMIGRISRFFTFTICMSDIITQYLGIMALEIEMKVFSALSSSGKL